MQVYGPQRPFYEIPDRLRNRPLDIIAIGSLVMERVIRVSRWPEPGGQNTVEVLSIVDTSGGCATNVSCFAGRVGGKASIVSAIGDGQYTNQVRAELAYAGVDTSLLTVHPGREGSLIIIMTDPSGDWGVLEYTDPELRIKVEDLPTVDVFARTKFLHVDGFSYVSAGEKAPVLEAIERSRQAGCLLSVDASVPAAKAEPEFLRILFHQADIVFANQNEALVATQAPTVEAAVTALQTMGPQVAVLKLGRDGSYVITPKKSSLVPAYEVDVVDTVAAGDAYIGVMLVSLCRGLPLMEAAIRGSAAGALACLGAGSLSHRFSPADIQALLERGPKKLRDDRF
ncbi:MAG: carbohydrate kinase family protein [Chloroflexi bacterium]|nr:carbohydrate kinase family protein [Chloroflexota bacterium]